MPLRQNGVLLVLTAQFLLATMERNFTTRDLPTPPHMQKYVITSTISTSTKQFEEDAKRKYGGGGA